MVLLDFEKSKGTYNKFIAQYQNDKLMPYVLYRLAEVSVLENEYKKAINIYQKIISDYPTANIVQYTKFMNAYLLYLLGDNKKSKEMFNNIVEKHSDISDLLKETEENDDLNE